MTDIQVRWLVPPGPAPAVAIGTPGPTWPQQLYAAGLIAAPTIANAQAYLQIPAQGSADSALASALLAAGYVTSAAGFSTQSQTYAANSLASSNMAAGYSTSAAASAAQATSSATVATTQAQQAAVSAAFQNNLGSYPSALPYTITALSGGIGTGTGGTTGTYQLTQSATGPAGAVVYGTVAGGVVTGYTISKGGLAITNTVPTFTWPAAAGFSVSPTAPTATVAVITPGTLFSAPSSDGTQVQAWGNNAGALATAPFGGAQASLPTSLGVAGLTITQGVYPATTAGTTYTRGLTLFSNTQIGQSGTLSANSVYVSAVVTGAIPVIVSISGGNATIQVQGVATNLASGVNTFTGAALATIFGGTTPIVQANWYMGWYIPSGTGGIQGGTTAANAQYCTGLPGASTAVTATVGPLSLGWQIVTGIAGEQARATAVEATLTAALLPTTTTIGTYPATSLSNSLTAGYTAFSENDLTAGRIGLVSVWMAVAGEGYLYVANRSGANFTPVAAKFVRWAAGQNYVYMPYSATAGQRLGVYNPSAGIRYGTIGGATSYYVAGPLVAGANACTTFSGNGIAIGCQIGGALGGREAIFESNTLDSPRAGFGLLDTADPSGLVDATSVFASAIATHPQPHVPLGIYNVTAIPNNGWGFWGEGRIYVNGVLLLIPSAPQRTSEWLNFRGAHASMLAQGGAHIILGDSITHGAFATTALTSYASVVTRWANLGIAVDEPVLCNFDNADTAGNLAFNGLSLSNPTTPTNGTNGPVGKSLLLAVGQVLTFTGAYEKINVTYTGVTGGQLAFAYNGGAAYKTVTCATSGLDVDAAAGATGQTVSGTWTITNTGSAAVEITSLMRFGVKSGTVPRIPVVRVAHGGYSFASYTSARITSALAIATIAGGGSVHYVTIALGTNDEVGSGLSYATLKANATTVIGYFTGAGILATNMAALLPWKWSSYTGSGSQEIGDGAVRDANIAAGVTRFIKTDGFDMIAMGLTKTGDGHPSDVGHIFEAQTFVAGWAR